MSAAWESSGAATAVDSVMWADPLVRLLQTEVRLQGERIAELERDNQKLQARVAELEGKVAAERRAGKRQAAPFSRGERKTDPAKSGRKPGQAYGTKARRLPPPPERVDEVVEVGLPECCPDCGGQVTLDEVVAQFQEELVPAHSRSAVTTSRWATAKAASGGCGLGIRSRPRTRWAPQG